MTNTRLHFKTGWHSRGPIASICCLLGIATSPIAAQGPFLVPSWTQTTALPRPSLSGGAVAVGDHILYVTGQFNYVGDVDTSTGAITGWRPTLALPDTSFTPRSLVRVGSWVVTASSPASYAGELASDGSILRWKSRPGTASPANSSRGGTAVGNRIYSIGGGNGVSTVSTFPPWSR